MHQQKLTKLSQNIDNGKIMFHEKFHSNRFDNFWIISMFASWRASEKGLDFFPTQVWDNENTQTINILLDLRLQSCSLRSFKFEQWKVTWKIAFQNHELSRRDWVKTSTSKRFRHSEHAHIERQPTAHDVPIICSLLCASGVENFDGITHVLHVSFGVFSLIPVFEFWFWYKFSEELLPHDDWCYSFEILTRF